MKSIKTKLAIATSIVIIIVVCLTAIPVITNSVNSETSLIQDKINYMMKLTNSEVKEFFAVIENVLLSSQSFVENGEYSNIEIEAFFSKLTKDKSQYITLLYYATEVPYKDGGPFLSDLSWVPPVDFDQTTRSWFQAAKNSTNVIVTEPYVDANTGDLVIAVAKQIRKNGRFHGVVAVDVVITRLANVVNATKLSPNGISYILSKEGLYVTNADADKVASTSFFAENNFEEYQDAVNTKEGFINLKCDNGKYLVGSQIDTAANWLFVSTGPSEEMFETITRSIRLIIVIAVAIGLVGILISGLWATSIMQPLTNIKSSIADIASGSADLTQRLELHTDRKSVV